MVKIPEHLMTSSNNHDDQMLLDGIRRSDNAVLEFVIQEFRPCVAKQIVGQGGTGKRGLR